MERTIKQHKAVVYTCCCGTVRHQNSCKHLRSDRVSSACSADGKAFASSRPLKIVAGKPAFKSCQPYGDRGAKQIVKRRSWGQPCRSNPPRAHPAEHIHTSQGNHCAKFYLRNSRFSREPGCYILGELTVISPASQNGLDIVTATNCSVKTCLVHTYWYQIVAQESCRQCRSIELYSSSAV